MIRVACVNQDRGIAPGRAKGAAVHLAAMREAFARLGCEVLPLDEPDSDALAKHLAAAHAQRPIDLLYERYALGADAAARFAGKHEIPLAIEVNAPLAEEALRYRDHEESEAEREGDRHLFRQADLVLAVSDAVAQYAHERGAAPERTIVCRNGVDETRFHPGVRTEVGDLPGLNDDTLVIGFHGRQRPWHRFDKLLACFRMLRGRDLPLHLLVVGEGRFEGLSELPSSDVTRLGWTPHEDMPVWVSRFDFLPLTHQPDSPFYFSPLKLAEAMACGVVPVVPDLGELPEQVGHGEAGLVYPAGDMDAMAERIAALIASPAQRRALGSQAAERALQHSWTGIARDVLTRLLPDREEDQSCRTG